MMKVRVETAFSLLLWGFSLFCFILIPLVIYDSLSWEKPDIIFGFAFAGLFAFFGFASFLFGIVTWNGD